MKTPQIIMIVLWAIALTITACKHGEYQDTKHNFWTTLISVCISATILILGGFFK